jgi:hypothetical protein
VKLPESTLHNFFHSNLPLLTACAQQLRAGFLTARSNGAAESQISRREVGNCRKYGSMFFSNCELFNIFKRRRHCTYEKSVTLKIEELFGEHGTTLKLIGRIRAEHLAELRGQIAGSVPSGLELGEVSLVDADAVRFLGSCESDGIQLLNCSAFIREWILRERETLNKK